MTIEEQIREIATPKVNLYIKRGLVNVVTNDAQDHANWLEALSAMGCRVELAKSYVEHGLNGNTPVDHWDAWTIRARFTE